jgi:hypothetical protein
MSARDRIGGGTGNQGNVRAPPGRPKGDNGAPEVAMRLLVLKQL